jgi:hypothetical protein
VIRHVLSCRAGTDNRARKACPTSNIYSINYNTHWVLNIKRPTWHKLFPIDESSRGINIKYGACYLSNFIISPRVLRQIQCEKQNLFLHFNTHCVRITERISTTLSSSINLSSKNTALWDITPCSLVEILTKFRRHFCWFSQSPKYNKATTRKSRKQVPWKRWLYQSTRCHIIQDNISFTHIHLNDNLKLPVNFVKLIENNIFYTEIYLANFFSEIIQAQRISVMHFFNTCVRACVCVCMRACMREREKEIRRYEWLSLDKHS